MRRLASRTTTPAPLDGLRNASKDRDRRSRREWFAETAEAVLGLHLAGGQGAKAGAQTPTRAEKAEGVASEAEAETIEHVRQNARDAGLEAVDVSRSAHFLAIGDAPASFRAEALRKICEPLSRDFLAYFRGRDFRLEYPKARMTVVVLKDIGSFRAFIGEDVPDSVAGQYELERNRLVMFDLRDGQRGRKTAAAAAARRTNTFALVHETIHLYCYNTGLLARAADVPRAISEGLAMYGELWAPPGSARDFGKINVPRLNVLRSPQLAPRWIPIAELLAVDDLFDQPESQQAAYSEAWLLVYRLLRPDRLAKFQAYLSGLPKLEGDDEARRKRRAAFIEEQLGRPGELDSDVRRTGRRLARR